MMQTTDVLPVPRPTMCRRLWRWLRWPALAAVVLLVAGAVWVTMLRQSWVESLPDVRLEMARPFVKESDLGPESAYRLLVEAARPPVASDEVLSVSERDPGRGRDSAPRPAPVWQRDWSDALAKFRAYPWPSQPPPSAAEADVRSELSPLLPTTVFPWTLEQCRDIERLMKLYEPRVAILDQAMAAPNPQMPTIDRFDRSAPYLSDVRDLVRWLAISAQYRAAHGDFPGAYRDLARGLAVGNLVSRGADVIGHLVGVACHATTAEAAWSIATRYRIPVPVLRQLAQTCLAASDEAEPVAEAMRVEWIAARGAVAWAYEHDGSGLGRMDFDLNSGELGMLRAIRLAARLFGSTPEASTRNLEACYQHFVAWAEQPYSAAIQNGYLWFLLELCGRRSYPKELVLRTRDPLGLVLAASLLPAIGGLHGKDTERAASLRGLALFLAVQAYRQEHDELPEALEQLVPAYLQAIPGDPYDGKPFRYLRCGAGRLPSGAWAVYSVGRDFADDRGAAHSVGVLGDDLGSNPDLVWPSRRYPPLDGSDDGKDVIVLPSGER